MKEKEEYLSQQIITYLGNKRKLLDFIGLAVEEIKKDLNKEKLDIVDLFSGSGIVSRYMKQHQNNLYVNDLESYCNIINSCYLTNEKDIDKNILNDYYNKTIQKLKDLKSGFISELYQPKDDTNIKKGERVFYTVRNANYIDTARQLIENIPQPYKNYLLAPLLYEASVHTNTSGVFKGFYKNSNGIGHYGGTGENALERIKGNIELKLPIFSNFNCNVNIFQEDQNVLQKKLPKVDLIYLDPPYNQHPYASNYFMLNLIQNYKKPDKISEVSGIPKDWNKSNYNKKQSIKNSMDDLCKNLNQNYIVISFSSDGFISKDEMNEILNKYGTVKILEQNYNTFRGSRNLAKRDKYVKEFLYILKKY